MMPFLKSTLAVLIALLAPIHALMGVTLFLIVVDLILGVWKAKKDNRKITSAALRRTVTKIFIYEFVIICGFLFQTYLMGGGDWVVKLISSIVGLVELKSILENANSILGGDIFKMVIQKLGSDNDKNKEEPKQ